jgi:hypothetical protein
MLRDLLPQDLRRNVAHQDKERVVPRGEVTATGVRWHYRTFGRADPQRLDAAEDPAVAASTPIPTSWLQPTASAEIHSSLLPDERWEPRFCS